MRLNLKADEWWSDRMTLYLMTYWYEIYYDSIKEGVIWPWSSFKGSPSQRRIYRARKFLCALYPSNQWNNMKHFDIGVRLFPWILVRWKLGDFSAKKPLKLKSFWGCFTIEAIYWGVRQYSQSPTPKKVQPICKRAKETSTPFTENFWSVWFSYGSCFFFVFNNLSSRLKHDLGSQLPIPFWLFWGC